MNDANNLVGPLWYASAFGRQNTALRDVLSSQNIESLELGVNADEVRDLIHLGVQGRESLYDVPHWTRMSRDEIWKLLGALPSAFSLAGLGGYRSLSYQSWREPTIAIAGNTLEDFCLYYAASRMRDRVVWVLPSVTDAALAGAQPEAKVNQEFHFATALGSLSRGSSSRQGGLSLVSATLDDEKLGLVQGNLDRVGMNKFQNSVIAKPSVAIPQHPIRYIESNNAYRIRSVILPDDGVMPLFETPTPKNFRRVDPSSHRWITELSMPDYQLPRHPALGWWTMGGSHWTTKEVRVSSAGLSYFGVNLLIGSGSDVETSTVRPSIRIPEPLQLFDVIARDAGLKVSVSDKGFYAEDSCKKFGGLAELALFLRSAAGRSFCSAFLDKTKSDEGDYTRGFFLSGRRYLDFSALNVAIGDEQTTATLIDKLSVRNILYRGFILQCEFCRRTDWFPVAEVTDAFTCRRCHRDQIYTRNHWMRPEQPSWFHQLDEIVYQGLEHHMEVPVLALDRLRRNARKSFFATAELSYFKEGEGKPQLECDINCVDEGLLTIGEGKIGDTLAPTERKELAMLMNYRNAAKLLGARQLVFATAAEQWKNKTLQNILKVFEKEPVSIVVLTRKELYD